MGGGPALGAFQMEPGTFEWLKAKFKKQYPDLAWRHFIELEWDLRLAIIMARLRYRVDKNPLPEVGDVAAQAAYWKRVYNTIEGAGQMSDFVDNWRRYVA
jgi:hypothetical protein